MTVSTGGSAAFNLTGGAVTSPNVTVGAQGGSTATHIANLSGGALTVANLTIGSGTVNIAAPASITVTNLLHLDAPAALTAAPGSTIHMTGSTFENLSTVPAAVNGLEDLRLLYEGGPADWDSFEVAGRDFGPDWHAGFNVNFDLDTLQLGGADIGKVRLIDAFDNQPSWAGKEALYVEDLIVGPGSCLDLNGLNLYYLRAQIDPAATIVNGTPAPAPEPATLALLAVGGLGIVGRAIRRGWRGRAGHRPASRLGITALTVLVALVMAGLSRHSARAGIIEAWGSNANGQLGDGTMTNHNSPVAVTGMSGRTSIVAASQFFSLALLNDGLYAWGVNFSGELGTGTKTTNPPYGILTPVAVNGMSSGVTAIAAGSDHSLAVQNGGAYAWGTNDHGQLGNGDGTGASCSSPVAVLGLSSGVTAVAGGHGHSLAVQNGCAYAWGWNFLGQLGNGTTTDQYISNPDPGTVVGLSTGVTAVAAGYDFSLALKNGGVYGWGDNGYSELGDGTSGNIRTTPVPVSGLSSGVTDIAAGYQHGLAVKGGAVYAWGGNGWGQVGDGTKTNVATPKRIDAAELTDIVEVAAGRFSSYALSADGSLWVWGKNDYGQLGLGTLTTDYLTPRHLLAPAGYAFRSIDADAEGYHVVATLAPVPEPATLALLAVGGLGLLGRAVKAQRR